MKKCALAFFLVFVLASGTLPTSARASDGVTMDKLNQILDNQNEILKELQEIKDELQIVKVRASLRS